MEIVVYTPSLCIILCLISNSVLTMEGPKLYEMVNKFVFSEGERWILFHINGAQAHCYTSLVKKT